jgi:hypothetical protein
MSLVAHSSLYHTQHFSHPSHNDEYDIPRAKTVGAYFYAGTANGQSSLLNYGSSHQCIYILTMHYTHYALYSLCTILTMGLLIYRYIYILTMRYTHYALYSQYTILTMGLLIYREEHRFL